jgi:rhamnosyltransferase
MSTAVVIRAFNEEAHIGRLLTGIQHQTRQPDEVVLVDSGSTDTTVSIAEAFGATIVPIDREEFSFGRALNRGVEASGADLIALASAHVYPVFDDWLERLLEPFEDERIGLTFGRQTVPPEGKFSERRLLEQWFPMQSRRERDNPFCNNANAAIRRDVWCGQPYDERLTGLEDLAWAKGIIERGKALAYVAEAPVVHVHDEGFSQIVNRYRREAIAHKAIYPQQSLDARSAVRLCVSNVARDLAAAQRRGELTAHFADIIAFRTAQFYGTLQGFSQSGPVTETLKRRFYYPPSATDSVGDVAQRGNAIDYDSVLERR